MIAEISPQANRQKATVQVKVQILNPDEYLRPEMNSTVKFLAEEGKKGGSQPSGVFVPTTAVRDHDGKKIVFISNEKYANGSPSNDIYTMDSNGAHQTRIVTDQLSVLILNWGASR